jgi:peroxiredoxin
VKKAVEEYGLQYPVVQDNDFKTRKNYDNRYWPAKYIIDKEGNVRYTHFGEGEYEETEKVIQYLL